MTQTTVQIQTRLKDALNVAVDLRRQGKYTEALRYMKNVEGFFDCDPHYLRRFHAGVGVTYFLLSEYEQAIAAYEKALTFPVFDSEEVAEAALIEGNIADSLVALKRPQEAQAFLDKSESILKSCDEVWYAERRETRARALMLEYRFTEAGIVAKEAVDILWTAYHTFVVDGATLRQAMKTLYMAFEGADFVKGK
jgi:tetratricopeptide (TPR) repeat protein